MENYPHPPEQQSIDPAQQIGLEQGHFDVRRTDGSIEQGWSISAIEALPASREPGAESVPFAKIEKVGDGEIATKYVTVDELKLWQPTVGEVKKHESNEDFKNSLTVNDRDVSVITETSNGVLFTLQHSENPQEVEKGVENYLQHLYEYGRQMESDVATFYAAGIEIGMNPEPVHALSALSNSKVLSTKHEFALVENLLSSSQHLRQVVQEQGRWAIAGQVAELYSATVGHIRMANPALVPNKLALEVIASGVVTGLSPNANHVEEITNTLYKYVK